MEYCHWLRDSCKKVIIKLSKRQDANKVQQVKKNEIVEFGVDGHK